MLLNFTVSNFSSFDSPQTFSMEGGRARGKKEHLTVTRHSRALKFAAMYGANAAGKSNFIKAMNFARNVISNGGHIPSGYTTSYNRTFASNTSNASAFEFEIMLGRKRYKYGFSLVLSSLIFQGEWLYDNTTDSRCIYRRDFGSDTLLNLPIKGDAETRVNIYFDDIRDDRESLFLTEMNRKKEEIYASSPQITFLRDLYLWFAQKLVFIYPEEVDAARYSFTFSTNKQSLCSKLNAFGLDITDYKFEQTSIDRVLGPIPEDFKKELMGDIEKSLARNRRGENSDERESLLFNGKDLFSFGLDSGGSVAFQIAKMIHGELGEYTLSEESDGTRRILELVEVLLSDDEDITFVIDEIDRSMHPLLTNAFISEYLSTVENRRTQLIITTHEARLLNTNRLRRDEVWFVEKRSGVSEIWRLDQMEDTEKTGSLARGDIRIETAYLNGRYGAIPDIVTRIDEDSL